jgi:hypothetical protein
VAAIDGRAVIRHDGRERRQYRQRNPFFFKPFLPGRASR